ncbi:MAG: HEAT repeat domain-containing protein [Geminocystis sp.]|nr:HEAT repeat domain-containing protein [Geminocystis sp.]HIK37875.1 HEAT repeat domain-containing protein [Geminocystis sp. M7585_C2015_104]MCS7146976.1 HEAT repeat domain-containing protein [Geminocystis sp.]MCX8077288.1 HEAT repeat domain-containing protein [Geminocystis sp.]MDW8115800.1 HEAT repeat domain-containing protein [Geminocystis sp.]
MNQTEIRYKANSLSVTPEEADCLLERVNNSLSSNSFDPNDHQTIALMVEALGDERGMMRLKFAQRLAMVGKPAVPFLLEALSNHPNPVVRRAAAKTLTLIAPPEAVPQLIHSLLHDEDTVVKGSCVGALAEIGEESVPELLRIIATERDETIKGHAAWALAFIGSRAKNYLYQAMASDSVDVRCAVVGVLGSLVQENEDEEALQLLFTSLHDPSPVIRCEAAAILGKIHHPQVASHLIPCLGDQEAEVRKAIALALMKVGDPSTIPLLQQALERETDKSLKPIFQLALNQLQRNWAKDSG